MSEPDFRKNAPLPLDENDEHAWYVTWGSLAASADEAGMTFVRMTVVNDEFPQSDVPHGCYIEGWLAQPVEQPAFSWPADLN